VTYVPPALAPDGGQIVDGEIRYLGYSVLFATFSAIFVGELAVDGINLRSKQYRLEAHAELRRDGRPVAILTSANGQPQLTWIAHGERDLFARHCDDWAEIFEWRAELWRDGQLPDDLDPRLAGQRAFVPVPRQWIVDFRNQDEFLPCPPRTARFLAFLAKQALENDVTGGLSQYLFADMRSVEQLT
jgi:hypothetical protein